MARIEEQLMTLRSNIKEQAMKKKYKINMTIAMPKLSRQLKTAMVRMTKRSIKKSRITEQTMPDELTFTSPKNTEYMNHGKGSLHQEESR